MGYGYCQSEIEGQGKCKKQCDHCKEYYAQREQVLKYRKQLDKVEKQLDKYRTSTMQDGWQTQKFAKKSLKWDYYSKLKISILRNMDACESDDPDDMCDNCNCWKQTRASCS